MGKIKGEDKGNKTKEEKSETIQKDKTTKSELHQLLWL